MPYEIDHYDAIADKLHNHALFDEYITKWVYDQLIRDCNLHSDDLLVDVGGGSGYIAQMLHDNVKNPTHKYICIDTSEGMIVEANKYPGVVGYVCSAEEMPKFFTSIAKQLPKKPNKFLFKGVVHHFANAIGTTFTDLYNWVDPGAEFVILTRDRNTPFLYWQRSKQVWAENTPDIEVVLDGLKSSGFDFKVERRPIKVTIPKSSWYTLVRERCHSHLHHLTDEEIEAGLKELDALHPGDTVPYTDEHIMILGKKKI